jgi:hypothetical protein
MDQVVAQALGLYQKLTASEEVVIASPEATAAVNASRTNGGAAKHENGSNGGSPRSKRRQMDDIIKS